MAHHLFGAWAMERWLNASRDGERVPGPATPLLVAAELSNGPGFSALHGAVWTFALHRCVQQDFWPCLLSGLGLNEYNSTPYETSKGPLLTSLLAEALHATGHASYMIAMLARTRIPSVPGSRDGQEEAR